MGLLDFLGQDRRRKDLQEESCKLKKEVAELLEVNKQLKGENDDLRQENMKLRSRVGELEDSLKEVRDSKKTFVASQPSTKIEKHGEIDSKYLVQHLKGADPTNPFYDKKVVISGTFEQIGMGRDEVAEKLQKLGAKIMRSVSKELDYFVIGNRPGPSKLAKVEGWQKEGYAIHVVSQIELKVLLDVADL